jgi:hypothetical protein
MTKRGYNQGLGIPFPSSDPNYFRVYALIKKGKSLEEALWELGLSCYLNKPCPSSDTSSLVQEDPDGFQGMILDSLSLIHGDLIRIEKILERMEALERMR